jgi:hypothetical protein
MLPGFPSNGRSNYALGHSEFCRQFCISGVSVTIPIPKIADKLICQFRKAFLLTCLVSFLGHHIVYIVTLSSDEKVTTSDTRIIVAAMQDVEAAFDWSILNLPCCAVREDFISAKAYFSVSCIELGSCPNPARSKSWLMDWDRAIFVYSFPESVGDRSGDVGFPLVATMYAAKFSSACFESPIEYAKWFFAMVAHAWHRGIVFCHGKPLVERVSYRLDHCTKGVASIQLSWWFDRDDEDDA